MDYAIGIAKNPRLLALAEPAMEVAKQLFEDSGKHIRHFVSIRYGAQTWSRERHIVVKAEHHHKGANHAPCGVRWVARFLRGFRLLGG